LELDDLTKEVKGRYHRLIDQGADPNEWAYAWRSEYNRGGFKAVDLLMEEVVNPGKCIGCAACVTICPVDVFDYEKEIPLDTRHSACVYCELCVDVCPVLRPTDRDMNEQIQLKEPVKDEGFGPYAYGCYARATDKVLVADGQDGGVCTALILHGMQNGSIKAAVAGEEHAENPQMGSSMLQTTPEEVMKGARSRYTYQANTLALVEAMKKDLGPLVVVGVPCQVNGVRQQQFSSIRLDVAEWYQENISLVVGLLCSEAFTEKGIDWLAEDLEVSKKDIVNINIKGRVEIKLRDGREEVKSLKKFGKYARPACLYCMDYSADNADIALGGIGMDKWTYTIIRTEAGHKAWQALIEDGWVETKEFEEAPLGKELVIRLSEYKRNRPLPALMPTFSEREEIGNLDPKNYYRGWEDGNSPKEWRPLPPPPPKKKKIVPKAKEEIK
jgi:coenzyme F420 hydrogenase subunit beta